VLEAAMHDYEKLARNSRAMELHNAAEISPKVALQNRQETKSNNTYNCPTINTF